MNERVKPGEIILEHASRRFRVQASQAGTLRAWLRGGRPGGPPPVPALEDVTLRIAPGDTVGMVGRNGAGKTSTLKVLAGIIPLGSGRAECGGRVVSLLELGAGFSRDFSGRENILLQGALFGFDRARIESRMDEIIAFSELGEFIGVPVRTYSQGMLLRLSFSIASHLDADVLLIDEVLAVGDEAFQRKCLGRIAEQIATGATLLLVSHELASIERVCERVVVLDSGRVAFDGPTVDGLAYYRRLVGAEHGGGASLRRSRAGAVDVVDVEVRDGAGRAASIIGAGEPLVVHVGLRGGARERVATVTLVVRSAAGPVLARVSTDIELVPDGTGVALYEIPELALLEGEYDLGVGAGVDVHEAATEQRTVRFAVADPVAGAEGGVDAGFIDLRGRWQVPASAEDRARTPSSLAGSPGGELGGPELRS